MIQFEAWLSLVERRVRDAEAASSNLVASMMWVLRNVEKSMFLRAFFILANGYSRIQNLWPMHIL